MSKKTEFLIDGKKIVAETGAKKTAPKKAKITTNEKTEPKSKKDDCEPIRDRKFCLTSYIDETRLYQFLNRAEWVQHFAMCTHDKDKNEDGTDKEKHTHIVLYTYNAKTASAVKKLFDRYSKEIYRGDEEPQNTLAQVCYDMVTQWRYLIHADDNNKFQYDQNDRICDDFSYWNKLEISAGLNDVHENTGLAMLTDYLNGTHPLEMARRYGKEYIYHLKAYQNFAVEVFKADTREQASNLKMRDLMALCLEGSPLNQTVIANFWVAYEYIISQINQNYNSQIDFYLMENNNA